MVLICAVIGGVCGVIVALTFRREPLLLTAILSAVAGTLAEVLLFSVGHAVTVVYPENHSLVETVEDVFTAIFLDGLGLFTLIFGGLPAAFIGYVCHRLLSWQAE